MQLTDLMYLVSSKLDKLFDTEFYTPSDTDPTIYGMYRGVNFEVVFTKNKSDRYVVSLTLESAIQEFPKIKRAKSLTLSDDLGQNAASWIRRTLVQLSEPYVEDDRYPHVQQMRETLHSPHLTPKSFFLPNKAVQNFGYRNLTELALMLARCVDNGTLKDFHFFAKGECEDSFCFVLCGSDAHKVLGYNKLSSLFSTWNALPNAGDWAIKHDTFVNTVSLTFQTDL